MKASNELVKELADTIAVQADALKRVTGVVGDRDVHSLALRLLQNAETLEEWTKQGEAE